MKEKTKSNTHKTLILVVTLIAITVIGIGALGIYVHKTTAAQKDQEYANIIKELEDRIAALINHPVVIEPVTPEVDLAIIDSKLQAIGELATMEYLYTDANRFTDAKKFLGINISTKSFVVKWDGIIKAGIDIDKISYTLDKDNHIITVYLPAPRILSHEILEETVVTLDEKSGLFNPIKVEDVNTLYSVSKVAMEKRAKENGLMVKSRENAELLISSLLFSVPGITEDYQVKFELSY